MGLQMLLSMYFLQSQVAQSIEPAARLNQAQVDTLR
jgi:hypothetical protein